MLTIIGFIAQLIDGVLGMGYGVTSSSLLLMFGITPAIASASIHLAEVVTTAASGISHIKFGNVDRQTVLKLIIPGSIGAFIGAFFLSNLSGDIAKPYISLFLLLLGVYVLFRFLFLYNPEGENKKIELSKKKSVFIGLIAGFADATGGGGWGAITTPVLLSQKGSLARKVIGTIDTSEFSIAISATLGFVLSLGWSDFEWGWVIALMAGGVCAAPIAAWFIRLVPSYILGVFVGGFVILTNFHIVIHSWSINKEWIFPMYLFILLGWVLSLIITIKKNN